MTDKNNAGCEPADRKSCCGKSKGTCRGDKKCSDDPADKSRGYYQRDVTERTGVVKKG